MDSILDRATAGLNKLEHFPSLPVFSCFAGIPEVHNDLFCQSFCLSLFLLLLQIPQFLFLLIFHKSKLLHNVLCISPPNKKTPKSYLYVSPHIHFNCIYLHLLVERQEKLPLCWDMSSRRMRWLRRMTQVGGPLGSHKPEGKQLAPKE